MPRRNRNAGTPRPDADQLAADLAQLAADLCPRLPAGHGNSTCSSATWPAPSRPAPCSS